MPADLKGDWAKARNILNAMPKKFEMARARALRQEAQALRNEIVKGITSQAPGGQAFSALSALTVAGRTGGGSKALIVTGELRNSIAVIAENDEVFIGVPRAARAKSGEGLINVAQIQEYGSAPRIIPLTPKMRRFIFAILRKAGKEPSGGGTGKGVVVVQTPARPFLRPAFEKFSEGASSRFLDRVSKEMGLG